MNFFEWFDCVENNPMGCITMFVVLSILALVATAIYALSSDPYSK